MASNCYNGIFNFYRLITLAFLVQVLLATEVIRGKNCPNDCLKDSTCVYEAKSCLSLYCEAVDPDWYKAPDTLISPGTNDEYDTDSFIIPSPTPFSIHGLRIKSLKGSDAGMKSYYAVNDQTHFNSNCSYNIFVYDLTNSFGSLHSVRNTHDDPDTDAVTWNVTETAKLSYQIDSFSTPHDFNFKHYALPMDHIWADDNTKIINSSACDVHVNYTWLNCLEGVFTKNFVRGVDNKVELGYTWDYPEEFVGIPVKSKVYTLTFELKYPPKVTVLSSDYTYHLINEQQEFVLTCNADGHPSVFNYTWTDENNAVLFTSNSDSSFTYTVKATSENDKFVVKCMVQNSIKTLFPDESQMTIRFSYNPIPMTTTTTTTTEKPNGSKIGPGTIAAIVIGSIALLALIVGSIVVICFCCNKKGKETERSGPPIQLNEPLTDNPLYASSVNNQNETRPPVTTVSSNVARKQDDTSNGRLNTLV